MLSWGANNLLRDGRSMSDIKQGVTLELFGEGTSMDRTTIPPTPAGLNAPGKTADRSGEPWRIPPAPGRPGRLNQRRLFCWRLYHPQIHPG